MPVPAVVLYGVGSGFLMACSLIGGKLAFGACRRKTMETETKCYCQMKEAGFSEEFVREVRNTWVVLSEKDLEFLMTLVERVKSGFMPPEGLEKAFAKYMHRSRTHARTDSDRDERDSDGI